MPVGGRRSLSHADHKVDVPHVKITKGSSQSSPVSGPEKTRWEEPPFQQKLALRVSSCWKGCASQLVVVRGKCPTLGDDSCTTSTESPGSASGPAIPCRAWFLRSPSGVGWPRSVVDDKSDSAPGPPVRQQGQHRWRVNRSKAGGRGDPQTSGALGSRRHMSFHLQIWATPQSPPVCP